jgi:cell division protein FtsZ
LIALRWPPSQSRCAVGSGPDAARRLRRRQRASDPPKPSLFPDHEEPMNLQEAAPPASFIPQQAERMPMRAPHAAVRGTAGARAESDPAGTGETSEEHPPQKRASLLQRLANVGLGRRDEESEPPIAARASGPAMAPMPPLPERKPQRPVPAEFGGSGARYLSMRAVRPRRVLICMAVRLRSPQGGAEDHLDIPAFCGVRPPEFVTIRERPNAPAKSRGILLRAAFAEIDVI